MVTAGEDQRKNYDLGEMGRSRWKGSYRRERKNERR